MKAELFLSNWADILGTNNENYIDYDSLIQSDCEFLEAVSFDCDPSHYDFLDSELMLECEF
jgi:hypothetical protein